MIFIIIISSYFFYLEIPFNALDSANHASSTMLNIHTGSDKASSTGNLNNSSSKQQHDSSARHQSSPSISKRNSQSHMSATQQAAKMPPIPTTPSTQAGGQPGPSSNRSHDASNELITLAPVMNTYNPHVSSANFLDYLNEIGMQFHLFLVFKFVILLFWSCSCDFRFALTPRP
jgi:hypothetical protein